MEARLLASEFLGKCGVFWYPLAAQIEALRLHVVTKTYREGAGAAGKAECWTLVLTMVRVIWRGLIKVRVEEETVYGSENPLDMVGK